MNLTKSQKQLITKGIRNGKITMNDMFKQYTTKKHAQEVMDRFIRNNWFIINGEGFKCTMTKEDVIDLEDDELMNIFNRNQHENEKVKLVKNETTPQITHEDDTEMNKILTP